MHASDTFEGLIADAESEGLTNQDEAQPNIDDNMAVDMDDGMHAEAAAFQFDELLKKQQNCCSPTILMALTLLCGTVKFFVKQYEIVRVLLKHASSTFRLPSYSTMQRKYMPHMIRNCFPRSVIEYFPSTTNRQVTANQGGRLRQTYPYTRVVLPTECARIDVATLPYFENIFNAVPGASTQDYSATIEECPIVRRREEFVNPCRYVFVDDRNGRTTAAAGDSISFTVRNISPGTSVVELRQQKFQVSYAQRETYIAATIIATWCVGSPLRESASSKAAISNSPPSYLPIISAMAKGSSPSQRTSAEAPRPQPRMLQRFFTSTSEESSKVFPGDICSPLSSIGDGDHPPRTQKNCCVIISRCVKKYRGMASQLVIWIRMIEDRNTGNPYTVIDVQTTADPPKLVCKRKRTSPGPYPSQFGTLQDGRQYIVHRMLLYCDEFKSSGSLYSQASCGGVYFLPIRLTQRARRSRTAVHVILLTPPGVSTNEVLLRIVPDIVKGTKGIDGVLPSGEPVAIFLDVVGFVADYPAAAEPLDILGHTADTPCTHCMIRKLKNNGSSTMGFATKLHSSFSPTLRCAERHEDLRESDLPAREMNVLGMKPAENATTQEYPLAMLREHLLAARPSIHLTTDNIPVITALFDPFR